MTTESRERRLLLVVTGAALAASVACTRPPKTRTPPAPNASVQPAPERHEVVPDKVVVRLEVGAPSQPGGERTISVVARARREAVATVRDPFVCLATRISAVGYGALFKPRYKDEPQIGWYVSCPDGVDRFVALSKNGELLIEVNDVTGRRSVPFLTLESAVFENEIVDLVPPKACAADAVGPVVDARLDRKRKRDENGNPIEQYLLRSKALGIDVGVSREEGAGAYDCRGSRTADPPAANLDCVSQDAGFGYSLRRSGDLLMVESSFSDSETEYGTHPSFAVRLPCGARLQLTSFSARDPGWEPNSK